ncbi:hypothetical protein BN13_510010 [Nostocoides jenkinsii Ben 74]|uniref:Uncharacterized protein n=1 Tax=Nostocoides jenkinsii Ben 74 TaxID=1193518 RepID=A0A077MDH4_9MICO|nr:hypothetical protein BN13_510010 [Tetrasphaera jenkinsii Ben 74]
MPRSDTSRGPRPVLSQHGPVRAHTLGECSPRAPQRSSGERGAGVAGPDPAGRPRVRGPLLRPVLAGGARRLVRPGCRARPGAASPIQGHAVWHVLCAGAAYALYRAYAGGGRDGSRQRQ